MTEEQIAAWVESFVEVSIDVAPRRGVEVDEHVPAEYRVHLPDDGRSVAVEQIQVAELTHRPHVRAHLPSLRSLHEVRLVARRHRAKARRAVDGAPRGVDAHLARCRSRRYERPIPRRGPTRRPGWRACRPPRRSSIRRSRWRAGAPATLLARAAPAAPRARTPAAGTPRGRNTSRSWSGRRPRARSRRAPRGDNAGTGGTVRSPSEPRLWSRSRSRRSTTIVASVAERDARRTG